MAKNFGNRPDPDLQRWPIILTKHVCIPNLWYSWGHQRWALSPCWAGGWALTWAYPAPPSPAWSPGTPCSCPPSAGKLKQQLFATSHCSVSGSALSSQIKCVSGSALAKRIRIGTSWQRKKFTFYVLHWLGHSLFSNFFSNLRWYVSELLGKRDKDTNTFYFQCDSEAWIHIEVKCSVRSHIEKNGDPKHRYKPWADPTFNQSSSDAFNHVGYSSVLLHLGNYDSPDPYQFLRVCCLLIL